MAPAVTAGPTKVTRRLLKNAFFLYGAEILSRGMTLLLAMLVARRLGATEFGELAFVTSAMVLTAMTADFGVSTYLTKAVAAERGVRAELVSSALLLKLCFSALAAVTIMVLGNVLGSSRDVRLLFFLHTLALPFQALSTTVSAVLRGQERMEYESVGKMATALLTTGIGVLLVLQGFGIVALGVLTLLLAVLNAVYFLVLKARLDLYRFVRPSRGSLVKHVLGPALPFGSLAVLVTISFRIDAVMLGLMTEAQVVGRYSAAYNLLEVLLRVPGLFAVVLLPAVAAMSGDDRSAAVRLTHVSLKYFLLASLPLAVGAAVLARPIILTVYGHGFSSSIPVLAVLAWALVPTFLSAITSTVISASPRPQVNAYIALLMATLNIGLNLVLIPRYTAVGAALTTVVTETVGLVLGTMYINRRIFSVTYHQALWRPALATSIFAVPMLAYPRFWLVPVYVPLYLACLVALKVVRLSEVSALRKAFSSRSGGLARA